MQEAALGRRYRSMVEAMGQKAQLFRVPWAGIPHRWAGVGPSYIAIWRADAVTLNKRGMERLSRAHQKGRAGRAAVDEKTGLGKEGLCPHSLVVCVFDSDTLEGTDLCKLAREISQLSNQVVLEG